MALKEEEREQKAGASEPKPIARRKSGTLQKKIKTSEYVGYLIDNICAVNFIYDVNFDAGKDKTGI